MERPDLATLKVAGTKSTALAASLFDAAHYLRQNTDVRDAGIDPLTHYLNHGWREGRSPAPHFARRGYLESYPGLEDAGVSPLVHAAAVSALPVNPKVEALFRADYYLDRRPELVGTGVDPLRHYLLQGWKDGSDPSPHISTEHYLSQVPELAGGDVSPLEHFVYAGMPSDITLLPTPHVDAAGRAWNGFWNPDMLQLLMAQGYDTGQHADTPVAAGTDIIMAMFSPDDYRRRHPQLADQPDIALLTRYLLVDLPEGVPPGPIFDAEHVRRQLIAAKTPPSCENVFQDWLKWGQLIGLSPNPAFNAQDYSQTNPDLLATFEHWIVHGLREHRQFMPNIEFAALPGLKDSDTRPSLGRAFAEQVAGPAWRELDQMRAFRNGRLHDLIAQAQAIEPMITAMAPRVPSYLAPWHDSLYQAYKACVERLPQGQFDSVVAIPFCKMGGSDFVSGVLARALARRGDKVLVLRTEQSDWERPDWFPSNVATADLSDLLTQHDMRPRSQVLYALLHHVEARRLFNVNSRAAYETMLRFGPQLSHYMGLYTYYFCADRRPDGSEAGYAIDFFSQLQGNLDCALIDNAGFAQVLTKRHMLDKNMADRVRPIYSPAMEPSDEPAVAKAQVASKSRRARPCILWAGRFDRQKRFDLVQKIAALLPGWDFLCWGKAVLEQQPDMSKLPRNMKLMGTYGSLDELPLKDCDGWLYTSGWDGLPTILIEVAARGMPVVASAVGGVPELIDNHRGWPVHADASADDYVDALRKMMSAPKERLSRAEALMARARTRHSFDHYCTELEKILANEDLA